MINNAVSELPLVEITLTANVRGTSVVLSQFRFIKEQLGLRPKAVMGGSEYDSATIIESIMKELHTRPRIAKNIRAGASPSVDFLLPVPLSVWLGLRCSPGEPFGIGKKIENVKSLSALFGVLKSLPLNTPIVPGFTLNSLKVLVVIRIFGLM